MVIALGSGKVKTMGTTAEGEFEEALRTVLEELAVDCVRNGEGVSHVIKITVKGGSGDLGVAGARRVGKAVVNSPLVKCAIAGNDPNVGRILGAVGKALAVENGGRGVEGFDPANATLYVCGELVFSNGCFRLDGEKEKKLSDALLDASLPNDTAFPAHEGVVDIVVDLGMGGDDSTTSTVWGADLTHEYVSENADYRS